MKERNYSMRISVSAIRYGLLVLLLVILAANQYLIQGLSMGRQITGNVIKTSGNADIGSVDLSNIKSTGQAIAALFPLGAAANAQDVINVMIPTGTPEYGDALGVSFDDPVASLAKLSGLNNQIRLTDEEHKRYMNIVSKPVGISCEFCCGVGPVGVDSKGDSICGCQHNPALLAVTKWLIKNTDYTDQEIVREALRWKTLFFPKDMTSLAMKAAGGDASALESVPGMVGGC